MLGIIKAENINEKTLGANYYVVKYIPRAIDYGLIDNKLLRH